MSPQALAVFDFCGTLTDFQTADPFVDFALHGRRTATLAVKDFARGLLYRARLLRNERHKRAKLGLLRLLPRADLLRAADGYVEQVVLPRVRKPVLDLLLEHKKNGDRVVLLSAGYQIYLEVFARRFGVDHVFGTKIQFTGERCDGVISGRDCVGAEKVRRLKQELPLDSFDLARSTAYGDAPSDLPVLALVGRKVIVATAPRVAWRPSEDYSVLAVPS